MIIAPYFNCGASIGMSELPFKSHLRKDDAVTSSNM